MCLITGSSSTNMPQDNFKMKKQEIAACITDNCDINTYVGASTGHIIIRRCNTPIGTEALGQR